MRIISISIFIFLINVISLSALNNVEKGVLDLRGVSVSQWNNIDLKGEWEFYWNKIIFPKDFNTERDDIAYIDVPGIWNDKIIDKQKLSGLGYGTYRLVVLTDSINSRLAIKIGSLSSASRLYVNGELIFEAGKVGENQDEYTPGFKPGVYAFNVNSIAVEIILQISNYDYARGGFWYSKIEFGDENIVRENDKSKKQFSLILLGALLFFSFYLFLLFLQNTSFKYLLYFSIVSVLIALRSIVVNEILILDFFHNLPWRVLIQLEYITLSGSIVAFLFFFYHFYKNEFYKPILWIYGVNGGVLSLLLFVTPTLFFTKLIDIYLVHLYSGVFYSLIVVSKAFINKRDGALAFIIGFVFLVYTIINDLLYNKEIIQSEYLASWGFLAFLIAMAYMLAVRYGKTHKQSINLATRLELLNADLEKLVEKRTLKVKEQNTLLQNKNSEIEKINQTKDTLFAIIAHDLKNPINAIHQLSSILDKDIETYNMQTIKKYIMHINESSKETYKLLENLLSWAMLQKGNINVLPKKVDLGEIIKRNIALLKSGAMQKSIIIDTIIINNNCVLADEEMVTVILRNLIHNAIKFSLSNKKIVVSIEEQGNYLKVCVKDEGVGIAKDDLIKIFDDNHTNQGIENSTEKGTGLGLVLCKEFVALNKGEIWVESEIDKGSVFCFTLPKTHK